MKRNRTLISLLLTVATCLALIAGCTNGNAETTEKNDSSPTEETATQATEKDSQTTENTETETEETETEPVGPLLEGEHAALIETADKLKNGVQAYFTDGKRNAFKFENLEMSLEYALRNNEQLLVTSLQNKKGKTYLENTMDVFVQMKDGKTYYASDSYVNATANIYRLGYYFYEMRFEEQCFASPSENAEAEVIKHTANEKTKDLDDIRKKNGELFVTNAKNATDPYIVFSTKLNYSADKFTMLEVTMRSDSKTDTHARLYVIAGDQPSFSDTQSTLIPLQNDNEYHTYRIMLGKILGYSGTVKGLRLDVSGAGASYSIKEIKLLAPANDGTPTDLGLNRSFMTYSDKMHHVIQIAATRQTDNIAAVGMLTEIKADTVAKLIVKDKNGTHETLDGVDWTSAEYVGFDIKGTGIFGYILPFDGKGGTMEVSLADGVYSIIQTKTPENGQILPSEKGTKNANDFYMGQRIYTDATHSFDAFIKEAECERNPLTEANIAVHEEYSNNAKFVGYDSLRGNYSFTVEGPAGGFNSPYYNHPNRHYRTNFTINGDKYDRKLYVLVHNDISSLECSALLDSNDVLLPVAIEVGKNFSEAAGERNLYNIDDPTYGESIFPMVVKANSTDNTYTLLNLYQLWGKYPLKQLSWIQYYCPYYHLSTGVSESNCILPWFVTKNSKDHTVLPDFRPMSAPLWADQPQRTQSGTHFWLEYTDKEGNYVTSENIQNTIDSHGPTYADVKMDYISDDGKIKISYVHTEMPQTDENRTYYEIQYEVLEDVSFADFSRDFRFYSVSVNDPTGYYNKIGYLDEANKSQVVAVDHKSDAIEYVLGKKCPYFSFFEMENVGRANGYSNVAFLVYNSAFVIGGKEVDPNFAIIAHGSDQTIALTLALDEVTLKAGDKFTINCILLPWGSQESDYSGSAPDKNVREVRENSLLDPLKATANADCTVLDSAFLPKLQTTNGESAEFTLSGGENNVSVRIYGFEKMTVPVIYEKIDGKWVEYAVSSKNTPDQTGAAHSYDGYNIYYDGDGTFSYAFVTTMKNGAPRTFKIVADGNYEKWEKEEKQAPTGYIDPSSGYTETDLIYTAHMDFINCQKIGMQIRYNQEVPVMIYNKTAISRDNINIAGNSMVFSGWAVVEGGVSKYVWSADGGKTWHNVSYCKMSQPGSASSAILAAASDRTQGACQFTSADAANASFQGSATTPVGLEADLSAYAGQTVNVTLAAVPAKAQDTLVLLYHVEGIILDAE